MSHRARRQNAGPANLMRSPGSSRTTITASTRPSSERIVTSVTRSWPSGRHGSLCDSPPPGSTRVQSEASNRSTVRTTQGPSFTTAEAATMAAASQSANEMSTHSYVLATRQPPVSAAATTSIDPMTLPVRLPSERDVCVSSQILMVWGLCCRLRLGLPRVDSLLSRAWSRALTRSPHRGSSAMRTIAALRPGADERL